MTDLFVPPFVPPPKSAAPPKLAVPANNVAGNLDDLDTPKTAVGNDLAGDLAPESSALAAEDAIAPTDSTPTDSTPTDSTPVDTVSTDPAPTDTVFFYGQSAIGSITLYQVNLTEGSLSAVAEPVDLYPTVLGGLFTAEAGGLVGLEAINLEEANLTEDSLSVATEPVAPTVLSELSTVEAEDLAGPEAVNLTEGSLSTATEPVGPAVPGGLSTAEAEGLAGLETVSAEPPPQIFTLVEGTDGKNFLIGTAANNAFLGLGSGDLILATGKGQNLLFGGAGDDTLIGGMSDDGLFGGADSDLLEGGAGDDLLVGGPGTDILYGGAGANTLIGGAEADVFRLNSPGAYDSLVGDASLPLAEADIIVDFSVAEGDVLDFSLIATQSQFAGGDLLPFLSFVQVGADTQVQVITPLGQVSTEAILLNVQADTLTPDNLTFTPPDGLPQLK